MEETMELVRVETLNAVQIFTGGGMNAVLDGIEKTVRSIPLDPSTVTGRDEIRSTAYRVVRTKTALDAEGKKLTEEWRKNTAKVNEERRKATERLDTLAEEVRKPLTDFENKEKLRVAGHEAALADLEDFREPTPEVSVEGLEASLIVFSDLHKDRNWEEFTERASRVKREISVILIGKIESRKKYDADQAELARLRQAEAERLQRERDERLKAEAAEKARLMAERLAQEAAAAERQRVAAEAERVRQEHEKAQRDAEEKRLAEERARVAAEKRAKDAEEARIAQAKKAEAEKLAAEVLAAGQLKAAQEKAKRDSEAAAKRERDKIEQERKAAEDARLKREADEANKDKIRGEITDDLYSYGMFDPDYPDRLRATVDAIMAGQIRHVKVVF